MKKQIKNYERYYVTDDGKIFNSNGIEIKQRKASNGYMRVNLRKGNVKYEKPQTYSVHRLVAEAFIPNPNKLPYVNHIDTNKTNNNVYNLEWCTPRENSIHACENIKWLREKYKSNIKMAQECNKKIISVYCNGNNIGTYKGEEETAKILKINEKTVRNGLTHKHKSKYGYTFIEVTGGGAGAYSK